MRIVVVTDDENNRGWLSGLAYRPAHTHKKRVMRAYQAVGPPYFDSAQPVTPIWASKRGFASGLREGARVPPAQTCTNRHHVLTKIMMYCIHGKPKS